MISNFQTFTQRKSLRITLTILLRLVWVLTVGALGYWGWNHLLSDSNQSFAKAAIRNPFIIAAALLLAVHIANFSHLARKLNQTATAAEPVTSERWEDWEKIERLYLSTFGNDVHLKFHRYALKMAFLIFCVGMFVLAI